MKSWSEVHPLLIEPFGEDEIKSRVQRTSRPKDPETKQYPDGTRGLMVDYIDARAVMDRLDDVVGPDCWSDTYKVIDANRMVVECTLGIAAADPNGEETVVTHSDVGYPNGKSSEEEHYKSSYSDALKRAAVKFGMGRHLYDRDPRWEDVNKYGQPVHERARKQERQPSAPESQSTGPVQERASDWAGTPIPSAQPELPAEPPKPKPASRAQMALIRSMAKSLGVNDDYLHTLAGVPSLTELTGGPDGTASKLIDSLSELEKEARA